MEEQTQIQFREVLYGSSEWKEAVQLREEILRKPLGSKFSVAELEEEENHFHIGGFINNQLIATAVLVPELNKIKMQRVAVKESSRNKKIGAKLLAYSETLTLGKGFGEIYCHARNSAVNFYLQNNYTPVGEYFEEDGIPHLKMIKMINTL